MYYSYKFHHYYKNIYHLLIFNQISHIYRELQKDIQLLLPKKSLLLEIFYKIICLSKYLYLV